MAADDLLRKSKKLKGDGGALGGAAHGKSNGKGAGAGGFQHLGLSPPVFRGVMAMGYKVPTPIQRKALPVVLSGKDCVAMARTGSGKTAAFLIPMLERLKAHASKVGVRALVLSPTRELAVQTLRFAKALAKFSTLKISLIVGGEGMEHQFETLAGNPDALVATPGRLMHHLQEIPDFNLKAVEYVVFDEADRIFEMGFAEQLQEILKSMPASRQTLLFSATLPKALVQFARAGLSEPELIRLDVERKFSENLKLTFFTVRSDDKPALFLFLLRDLIPAGDQTIVFAATRHHVEFLHALLLANRIEASCVYGDMDPASRKINIGKFRAKKTHVLLVTDVAARGIDIPLLNNVLNYSFPPTAKLFVHRVGRAARAGRSGTAFSLVDPDETPFMVDLHLYIGRRLEDSAPTAVARGYSLADMKVSDVHYGAFPDELVDRETEHLAETLRSHPQVAPLVKVCANAYKMYARTRADPSKLSIKRAKELLVKKVHPLFMEEYTRSEAQVHKAEYIDSLRSFRPPQTIFEVATGAHAAKKTAPAVVVMASKRKLHEKIIQTEAKRLKTGDAGVPSAEGDDDDQPEAGQAEPSPHGAGRADGAGPTSSSAVAAETSSPARAEPTPKKTLFLSKFERKQVKKRVAAGEREEEAVQAVVAAKEARAAAAACSESGGGESAKEGEEPAFRDREHYIGYLKQEEQATEAFLSKSADGGKVNAFQEARLEEAILDVNPDEAMALNRQRRVLHWDTRKKKFVRTTAGELTSHGALKRRNESGAALGRRKKQAAGELYKKWQQKQHKRVWTGGEEDAGAGTGADGRKLDYRHGRKPHLASTARANRHAKPELLGEAAIRKEEKRKARSRGVKVAAAGGSKGKRDRGNVKGKSHGAPSRSKAILRR